MSMPLRKASIEFQPTPNVQVIAVAGAKGGVGKTTVAVNLATALARADRKVLLLDGDLGLASVDVLLGLTPAATLEQVLAGERQLEEILMTTPEGVTVIPAASGVARMARLPTTENAAIVRAFSSLPGNYDTLIVDTAPGVGESVLLFCQAAHHHLIVIRDEPASLTDAYALIKVLRRDYQVHRFHVLVNMSRADLDPAELFGRLQRVTDRFLDVALEFAGEIPDDEGVHRAVRAQRPVMSVAPTGPASRAFRRLATQVTSWAPDDPLGGGLSFFFERLVQRPVARFPKAVQ
jgi:flagellar biosynthesis protein FlhG